MWVARFLHHDSLLGEVHSCLLEYVFWHVNDLIRHRGEGAGRAARAADFLCRPHYSGTTLDAQARYAAGTKEILRRTFDNEPLNETDVIVQVAFQDATSMQPCRYCTCMQDSCARVGLGPPL